jgi:glucan phosphoethanolaminetransferase (alkaline phosphatase superfamily)
MCYETEYYSPRDLILIIPTGLSLILLIIMIILSKEQVVSDHLATGLGILSATLVVSCCIAMCFCTKCSRRCFRRDITLI